MIAHTMMTDTTLIKAMLKSYSNHTMIISKSMSTLLMVVAKVAKVVETLQLQTQSHVLKPLQSLKAYRITKQQQQLIKLKVLSQLLIKLKKATKPLVHINSISQMPIPTPNN